MSEDALKDHLLHQFRYMHHADRQVIEALETLGAESAVGTGNTDGAEAATAVPERALRLLSHLLRSQDVWLGRVRGKEELPAIWEKDSLSECRERAERSARAWRSFLRSTPDLTETVRYENSKGTSFRNQLREICAHVVDHSSHHRAQILALIREAGGEPPVTGYVFFARDPAMNARHPH